MPSTAVVLPNFFTRLLIDRTTGCFARCAARSAAAAAAQAEAEAAALFCAAVWRTGFGAFTGAAGASAPGSRTIGASSADGAALARGAAGLRGARGALGVLSPAWAPREDAAVRARGDFGDAGRGLAWFLASGASSLGCSISLDCSIGCVSAITSVGDSGVTVSSALSGSAVPSLESIVFTVLADVRDVDRGVGRAFVVGVLADGADFLARETGFRAPVVGLLVEELDSSFTDPPPRPSDSDVSGSEVTDLSYQPPWTLAFSSPDTMTRFRPGFHSVAGL
jgi:hypothetical protein